MPYENGGFRFGIDDQAALDVMNSRRAQLGMPPVQMGDTVPLAEINDIRAKTGTTDLERGPLNEFGETRDDSNVRLGKSTDYDSPGARLDTSAADSTRQGQLAALQLLQQQAASGDGSWQQTFIEGTRKANANATAIGQSQRGQSLNSMSTNIGNAQGAVAQNAVGQEDMLRSRQKQEATSKIADLTATMNAQDMEQEAAAARARQEVRAANATAQQEKKARERNQIMGATQSIPFIGGLIGTGLSAALGLSDGGEVPGQPRVFGDDERNDTVHAKLSPGEIVIPRSITQSGDAPELAEAFVRAIQAQRGSRGDGFHFAEGGVAPTNAWKPGDFDVTSQKRDERGVITEDADLNWLGAAKEAPSIENGALFDRTQSDASRVANAANDAAFIAQIAGTGPSGVRSWLQRASDQNLAAASQASGAGRRYGASAADAIMSGAQGSQNAVAEAAGLRANEANAAMSQLSRSLSGQRQRDAFQAQAQRDALWRNTMLNIGIDLQNQAALDNVYSGAGQAAAAWGSASSNYQTPEFQARSAADAKGERGGYTDLSYGEEKAFGGEVGPDEDEKRRAIEFVNSLRGGDW